MILQEISLYTAFLARSHEANTMYGLNENGKKMIELDVFVHMLVVENAKFTEGTPEWFENIAYAAFMVKEINIDHIRHIRPPILLHPSQRNVYTTYTNLIIERWRLYAALCPYTQEIQEYGKKVLGNGQSLDEFVIESVPKFLRFTTHSSLVNSSLH